ncbi:hypothetical protein BCR37DRAFT_390845 [Protomyces lactucae-debilis]|uniref:Uncharacterized protein n=1 Tax=Protomyces lactucae-debilis TaxID=2754530 RepID=A0A1Y2FT19_PROLT|nr:uncharacterized protein BCR37DRAFT_390845 [Protomyces lactucae-debilis]ORY87142.1 hypothetical protein BCR37DRAFT_390845 [Protomyces lactucae-debilis]
MTAWSQLPPELIFKFYDYAETIADTRCGVLVCRSWYHALTPLLYRSPVLRHADDFTILCEMLLAASDKATEQPHPLAKHIRVLDLHAVCGTLRVIKLPEMLALLDSLQAFIAPQAALAASTMLQLAQRPTLKLLDFAWVIERFELPKLLNAVSRLPKLHTFRFPRCAVSTVFPVNTFPQPLNELTIRGGLRDAYVTKMASSTYPTIKAAHVEVSHAPVLTGAPILDLLSRVQGLLHVTVQWPLPRFAHNAMDTILVRLPFLKSCSLSIDYISARFFENHHSHLEKLLLTFSGVGKTREITAEDLLDALENEDLWPALRTLQLVRRLQELLFPTDEELAHLERVCAARGINLSIIDWHEEEETSVYGMFGH